MHMVKGTVRETMERDEPGPRVSEILSIDRPGITAQDLLDCAKAKGWHLLMMGDEDWKAYLEEHYT